MRYLILIFIFVSTGCRTLNRNASKSLSADGERECTGVSTNTCTMTLKGRHVWKLASGVDNQLYLIFEEAPGRDRWEMIALDAQGRAVVTRGTMELSLGSRMSLSLTESSCAKEMKSKSDAVENYVYSRQGNSMLIRKTSEHVSLDAWKEHRSFAMSGNPKLFLRAGYQEFVPAQGLNINPKATGCFHAAAFFAGPVSKL